MTQEALKKMYQLLLTEPHAETVCFKLEAIAREALAQPPLPVQPEQDFKTATKEEAALKQVIDLIQPVAALADRTPFEHSEVIQRCVDAVEIALEALAQPVQENQELIEWKEQGEAIMAQAGVGFRLGAWWADRPWRQK